MATERDRRVALITGASRGIGAAVARRLAFDGFAVVLNSSPDENMVAAAKAVVGEIEEAGGHATVIAADISDSADVGRMFTQCEQHVGSVDAVVLNAAVTARESWSRISEETWDRIMDVNLKGALLCCQRAVGEGCASPSAIVTISSVLAKTGAPNSLHYATTKAGVIGFTRSLARELGPRGTRVNCVMPGAIQTEEELQAFPDQDEVRRVVLGNQFLQRRGQPSDIADVVSFLVGQGSSFITGQTICVDGGWVLL